MLVSSNRLQFYCCPIEDTTWQLLSEETAKRFYPENRSRPTRIVTFLRWLRFFVHSYEHFRSNTVKCSNETSRNNLIANRRTNLRSKRRFTYSSTATDLFHWHASQLSETQWAVDQRVPAGNSRLFFDVLHDDLAYHLNDPLIRLIYRWIVGWEWKRSSATDRI